MKNLTPLALSVIGTVKSMMYHAQIPQKLQDAINNGTLFMSALGAALIIVFLIWAGISFAAKKDFAELKVQIIGIVVGIVIIGLAEELATLIKNWVGM